MLKNRPIQRAYAEWACFSGSPGVPGVSQHLEMGYVCWFYRLMGIK